MSQILEKDIKKAILQYLRLKKIFAWNNRTVGIRKVGGGFIPAGMVGISDVLGCLPDGRFLAVEVKRPGNFLTTEQLNFLARINENKGLGFTAYSLDDVISILQDAGYITK